ncbi:MAG TPA: 3'-5' exonuclease [Rhizomicrobium sp.]|nr:3'-5' exonuclease [Rhizomicrobium sp.]
MTAFPQKPGGSAVVYDLEFTAWEGSMANRWSRPGEFAELVQIGAVRVNAETFAVEAELDVLVRPRLNPVLSDYFTELTGITNGDIAARGLDFAIAYRQFLTFCEGCTTLAFGTDDVIFVDNIRLYGLSGFSAPPPFSNLRPWFNANGVPTARLHSCDVGPALGVAFEGRQHNALADAHSLVAGIRVMLGRGARNPLLS